MDEQRNYTGSAFWITLIVVVMTVGMSLIPGFQVGRASVKIGRASCRERV